MKTRKQNGLVKVTIKNAAQIIKHQGRKENLCQILSPRKLLPKDNLKCCHQISCLLQIFRLMMLSLWGFNCYHLKLNLIIRRLTTYSWLNDWQLLNRCFPWKTGNSRSLSRNSRLRKNKIRSSKNRWKSYHNGLIHWWQTTLNYAHRFSPKIHHLVAHSNYKRSKSNNKRTSNFKNKSNRWSKISAGKRGKFKNLKMNCRMFWMRSRI